MLNALSHRDYYDRGSKIMVELFNDKVEITNPGGLVSAIKPDEFGTKSHSRNPLIFGLFNRVDMVEQVGCGIGRITRELEKLGHAKPVYKTEGLFTVVFSREMPNVKLGVNERNVFNAIQNNPDVTISAMAKLTGVSTTSIENNLKKLKDKHVIERVGSDKIGHWVIIKQE